MTILLIISVVSLFSNIELITPLVVLRPFDLLVGILFFYTILRLRSHTTFIIPKGLYLFFPFIIWHVLSAFTLDMNNGIRELLQSVVIVMFGYALYKFLVVANEYDIKIFYKYVVYGFIVICLYTIIWHVINGYYVGWKRLGDTKYVFTFLPMIMGFVILFAKKRYGFLISLWIILGIILLLSGERKSWLIYIVLSLTIFSKNNVRGALPFIMITALVIMTASLYFADNYLMKKFNSIVSPSETVEFTVDDIRHGNVPESMSNAQRVFAVGVGLELFRSSPIIGVGTNGYARIVKEEYGHFPRFLTIGIHNEFFRVIVENGAIGLILFVLLWVYSVKRSSKVLSGNLIGNSKFRKHRKRVMVLVFSPLLISIFFEASGSQAMIIILVVSLMPEIFRLLMLHTVSNTHLYRTQQSQTRPC